MQQIFKNINIMRKILLALSLVIAMVSVSMAQSTTLIGTTDTVVATPIVTNWKYSISQQICKASELMLPECDIVSISIMQNKVPGSNNNCTRKLELYMANTNKQVFSDQFDYVSESQMTKVYDHSKTLSDALGEWVKFEFDVPFHYDGNSNLLLYTRDHTGNYTDGSYGFDCWFAESPNTTIYCYSDDYELDAGNASSAAFNYVVNRNNLLFIEYIDGASQSYGILFGETEITSDNMSNIQDNALISGSASFNPSSNTLTLDNVVLEESIDASSFNSGNHLTINVVGNCTIYNMACSNYVDTYFTGNTSATLNAASIYAEANSQPVKMAIYDINVNVEDPEGGYQYGIYGYGNEYIFFFNCNVEVHCNLCPVDEFLGIFFTDCHIAAPVGAVVENGCIRVNGEHNIKSVSIVRDGGGGEEEDYNIRIGDTPVTSANASDISSPAIQSGSASFDPSTNTLTLNNLVLKDAYGIDLREFNRGDLTVKVVGACTLYNMRGSNYCNTTIIGNTSATLNAADISVNAHDNPVTLTIANINTNVQRPDGIYSYGIYGMGGEYMVFDNCNVNVHCDFCPVDEFIDITFKNCHIAAPAGAAVENGCIMVNGIHGIKDVTIVRDDLGVEDFATVDFTVSPNPATDIVTFHGVALSTEGYLTLSDATGKTIAAVRIPANDNDYTMDVATLPAGVYFINITAGTTHYTSKLVKK